MVYSVNNEGVEALKGMASAIISAAENLLDNSEKLKDAGAQNNLGPHSESVVNAGETIFQAVVQAAEPIQDIADNLNDVAEAYEEVIGNDRIAGVREDGGYESRPEKEMTTGAEKVGERAPSTPPPGADSWAQAFPDAGNSSGWDNMEPQSVPKEVLQDVINDTNDKATLEALRDKLQTGQIVVESSDGDSDKGWPKPPQRVLKRTR